MTFEQLFARIPVADRDRAEGFYERLLGRPPDLVPNEREAAWRVTETGWIYIETDPPLAGSSLHTLLVDDLEGFLEGIAETGIEAGPVETIAQWVRQVILTDDDGNRLKVGQAGASRAAGGRPR